MSGAEAEHHPMDSSPAGSASGLTDASLLERVKNGDENAWEQFAELVTQTAYAVCRRKYQLQCADARDVAHEVFLKVHAYDLGRIGEFRPWLRTVIRNTYVDFLRKRGKGPPLVGELDEVEAVASDPLSEVKVTEEPSDEDTDCLIAHQGLRLLGKKNETKRRVVWETIVNERRPADLAEELSRELGKHVTPASVRKTKERGLKSLRKLVEGLLKKGGASGAVDDP